MRAQRMSLKRTSKPCAERLKSEMGKRRFERPVKPDDLRNYIAAIPNFNVRNPRHL